MMESVLGLEWWALREVAIDGAGMGKKNCSIVRLFDRLRGTGRGWGN